MEGRGRSRAAGAPQRGRNRGRPAASPRRAGGGRPAVVCCGAKGRAPAQPSTIEAPPEALAGRRSPPSSHFPARFKAQGSPAAPPSTSPAPFPAGIDLARSGHHWSPRKLRPHRRPTTPPSDSDHGEQHSTPLQLLRPPSLPSLPRTRAVALCRRGRYGPADLHAAGRLWQASSRAGPHSGSPHRVRPSRANPIAGIELPECLACSNSRPGTSRNNRAKSRGLTAQP